MQDREPSQPVIEEFKLQTSASGIIARNFLELFSCFSFISTVMQFKSGDHNSSSFTLHNLMNINTVTKLANIFLGANLYRGNSHISLNH